MGEAMEGERPGQAGTRPGLNPPNGGQGLAKPQGRLQNWRRRVAALHQEVYALYLACRDRRCPWYARLVAAGVVAYAFSPIDLIPDFIPILGLLDDLVLVPLGVVLVRRLMPAGLLEECRTRARENSGEGRPVSWVGGAVIVCVWLGSAVLAFYAARKWLGT